MLLYFAISLFTSALLLFLVQPMIGKMILPQLGGTPAVWNTCMVFFQGVLLVGYGYTHILATTQPTRRQVLIHGVLLFLPFLVLPFSLGDWAPPTESNPIFSLMVKLTVMVGLPFFLVSTTAPLLQKWFFHTGHPASKDPYFLYGASNFGSMLGLALYPTVMEPWLRVTPGEEDPTTWETQVMVWTFGYGLFVALVVGCAIIVWRALEGKFASAYAEPAPTPEPTPAPTAAPEPAPAAVQATSVTATTPKKRVARLETSVPEKPALDLAKPDAAPAKMNAFWATIASWYTSFYPSGATQATDRMSDDNITMWRRIRWIGLAAAPSSLMLGVTTYMTTDIAAVAFFWIIPLMLYLLTFILVFSRWPTVWTGTPHTVVMFLQPMFLLLLVLKMIANLTPPTSWATVIEFILHLSAFFTTTLMCHGELAKDRPSTKHLTEFYFFMSLGGVMGGLFNAFFAPIFFQYGIWEYPVAMVLACLMRSNLVDQPKTLIPGDSTAVKPTPFGIILDFGVPILMGLAAYGLSYVGDFYAHKFFLLKKSYLLAVLVVIVLALSLRPVRFGLSVATLFIAVTIYDRQYDPALYEGRGFFGLLRVRESDSNEDKNWMALPARPGKHPSYEWKVYRTLIHGGINHGRQIVRYQYEDENGVHIKETDAMNRIKRREPITYFHEANGVAELFHKLSWHDAQPPAHVVPNMPGLADARMPASMVGLGAGQAPAWNLLVDTQSNPPYAVLGLGTGILACYAKPYQHVDIYEIDPLVKSLSIPQGYVPPWDPNRKDMPKDLPDPVFYFMEDAQERWANINVHLGDGRLQIRDAHADGYYHVIVLDAFSSDAIPVHLLTKEAVQIYLSKLAPGGVLLFNTTNRYVRIEEVLAALAEELDCDCLRCDDWTHDATDHPDRFSADWVVLQPRMKTIGARLTKAKGGMTIRSLTKNGPAAEAGLKVGDVVLKVNGKELGPDDLVADLLADRKPGESFPLLASGKDGEKEYTLTLPWNQTGGRPIRERLESERKRLTWYGAVVKDGEGKEVIDRRWRDVTPLPGPVWTDGFSNLLNPRVMPWLAPWKRN